MCLNENAKKKKEKKTHTEWWSAWQEKKIGGGRFENQLCTPKKINKQIEFVLYCIRGSLFIRLYFFFVFFILYPLFLYLFPVESTLRCTNAYFKCYYVWFKFTMVDAQHNFCFFFFSFFHPSISSFIHWLDAILVRASTKLCAFTLILIPSIVVRKKNHTT